MTTPIKGEGVDIESQWGSEIKHKKGENLEMTTSVFLVWIILINNFHEIRINHLESYAC